MGFHNDDLAEHLDALYRYALGVTRDPDLAADIVQDTIVRAIERRHQYRADAPLSHWLIRIAHNLVVDRARRASREIPVEAVEQDWRDDTSSSTPPPSPNGPRPETSSSTHSNGSRSSTAPQSCSTTSKRSEPWTSPPSPTSPSPQPNNAYVVAAWPS
jgi:RNA polymerase sigma factor (sigma-70 family)